VATRQARTATGQASVTTGQRKRRPRSAANHSIDPADSAEAAGLRYVSDTAPGITRRRAGDGFRYLGADGKPVRDAATLARIRSLAIPPAYRDVWICPSPRGHIQATGRDARGRKQYRYHPKWRDVRDETKFGRMLAFSDALPAIRQRIERDMARTGLPREKVLATVVRLLESTRIRVGNDEYTRANRSFGLTTLRDQHVEITGSKLRFEFRGKSGKRHTVGLTDRRLARIVRQCQAIPGAELFQYLDDDGQRQTIGSGDVNDYIREITGQDFTAKDFRTWGGTMLAAEALAALDAGESEKDRKAAIVRAVDQVAGHLNNTRAICRKYYVHPLIFESFLAGTLARQLDAGGKPPAGLTPHEAAVISLLRKAARAAAA
jgi:DNA topoisomerase-1